MNATEMKSWQELPGRTLRLLFVLIISAVPLSAHAEEEVGTSAVPYYEGKPTQKKKPPIPVLVPKKPLITSLGRHASSQVLYALKPDQHLYYYRYQPDGARVGPWPAQNKTIGNGWNVSKIFSGGNGVIFAVSPAHELLYAKYTGLADGSFSWTSANAKVVGTGWNFRHLLSAGDGVILAIDQALDLYYYKFLGMNSGAESWGITHRKIGNGWNFRQVFSGGNGVIFAINDAGDLLYYKYLGLKDGSATWGPTGNKIGTGWNFRKVFSGGRGIIFAINDANDLLYFEYLGMNDGTFKWGTTNLKVGNGWGAGQFFAEIR